MLDIAYMLKGCSPTILYRSERLLKFTLGTEKSGAPVTVATMLARLDHDPVEAARHLIRVWPEEAVAQLARASAAFRIDGSSCPDPEALARTALAYAGRAVGLDMSGSGEDCRRDRSVTMAQIWQRGLRRTFDPT
jgi:hypothetical protein